MVRIMIFIFFFTVRTLNFKFTKEDYAPVDDKSPMFALDCEMVCIILFHLPMYMYIKVQKKSS